jgi:hypothetical protein
MRISEERYGSGKVLVLAEQKLDRYLSRTNAEVATPIDRTDKLLQRLCKETTVQHNHRYDETVQTRVCAFGVEGGCFSRNEDIGLDRYLSRTNAEVATPIDRTDKLLQRLCKEGYIITITAMMKLYRPVYVLSV